MLAWILAGSGVAIAALAVLNWLLFGWSRAQLTDLDAAKERLRADLVEFSPSEGVLSSDGRAALVLDAGGARVGLVIAHGAHLVTRAAQARDIQSIDAGEGGELTLALSDFTFAKVTVRCADARAANAWADRLRALS